MKKGGPLENDSNGFRYMYEYGDLENALVEAVLAEKGLEDYED
jgi:hypothetical protein